MEADNSVVLRDINCSTSISEELVSMEVGIIVYPLSHQVLRFISEELVSMEVKPLGEISA